MKVKFETQHKLQTAPVNVPCMVCDNLCLICTSFVLHLLVEKIHVLEIQKLSL